MVIQIVLIALVVVAAFAMLRGQGARRQALRRLGLLVFAAAAVWSILMPDQLTELAQLVNVGRGTDLLLYALIVVFISYVVTRHRRDQRTAKQITALSRQLALDEAPPPRDLGGEPLSGGETDPLEGG